MIRKTIGTAVIVGLVGFWLFGREACSYIRTSTGWIRSSVKDSVPVGFEIDRARQLVRDLVPDIRRSLEMIAKEEVELEQLASQIDKNSARLEQDKAKLMTLKNSLSEGRSQIVLAGRSYTPVQVQNDLTARFDRFKDSEATLVNLRRVHAARAKGLEAARQKVEGMLITKRDLEVEIEHLEARHKMVEAAQASSDLQLDDSSLARVKNTIAELQSRLQVSERMLNVADELELEIPLDTPADSDIVDQVTQYFDGDSESPSNASLAATEIELE